MERKATIADVAKKVGVSKTTISRYLNGNYEFMSQETRQRIEQVIKELDYAPNSAARTLKSQKSKLVGVVVNSLRYQIGAQTVTQINSVCAQNGYGTVVCCSNDDPAKEEQAIQLCLNQQVDGLVLIPCHETAEPYLALCKRNIPVVICTRQLRDWPYGSVYVKHDELIANMLQHLKEQGFEKVCFLQDVDNFHKKWMGDVFAQWAEKLFGMQRKESVALVGREELGVAEAVEQFLREYPDQKKALFAVNTHTLFLTLKEVEQHGLRMPEDIGVCGYDAVGWSELVAPGISSIRQPMDRMGRAAGEKIIEAILQGRMSEGKQALSGTLTFRRSTQLSRLRHKQ